MRDQLSTLPFNLSGVTNQEGSAVSAFRSSASVEHYKSLFSHPDEEFGLLSNEFGGQTFSYP
jgi:hypothetical protein